MFSKTLIQFVEWETEGFSIGAYINLDLSLIIIKTVYCLLMFTLLFILMGFISIILLSMLAWVGCVIIQTSFGLDLMAECSSHSQPFYSMLIFSPGPSTTTKASQPPLSLLKLSKMFTSSFIRFCILLYRLCYKILVTTRNCQLQMTSWLINRWDGNLFWMHG